MRLIWAVVVVAAVAAGGDGTAPTGEDAGVGGGGPAPLPVGPPALDAGEPVSPAAADGGARTEADRLKEEELHRRRELDALRAQLEQERETAAQLREANDQLERL